MSGLDYYGRLMRRATARPDVRTALAADPFDATAPWPIEEARAAVERVPAIEPPSPERPRVPSPIAPPAIAPAPVSVAPIEGPDADIKVAIDALRPADSPVDAPPSERRTDASPAPVAARVVTPLVPGEPAPVPQTPPRRDERAPRDGAFEPPHITVEAVAHASVAAVRGVARPDVPTAAERPAPPRAPQAGLLQPPAPPLHVSAAVVPDQPAQAPVISIGEIDIDIDHAAAAAPPRPAAPLHPAAREARVTGRVEPDLLRGPTHRAFGLGQV